MNYQPLRANSQGHNHQVYQNPFKGVEYQAIVRAQSRNSVKNKEHNFIKNHRGNTAYENTYFPQQKGNVIQTKYRNSESASHNKFLSLSNSRANQCPNQQSGNYYNHENNSHKFLERSSSSGSLLRPTMKLSMKNMLPIASASKMSQQIPADRAIKKTANIPYQESLSLLKESNNSTTMIPSEALIQSLQKQLKRWQSELQAQLNEQRSTIEVLQRKIKNQNQMLLRKQEQILKLQEISNRKHGNSNENPENSSGPTPSKKMQIEIMVEKIEKQVQVNRSRTQQQAFLQSSINRKIDELMLLIENRQLSFGRREKEYESYLGLIRNKLRSFNDLIKQIRRQPILEETARFPTNFAFLKSLDESSTYFFHPEELKNMDRINEIFEDRKSQPISCYTDTNNHLKYQDTHTFVFDKKGDIIQLTDDEKRYYVDKGYISQQSFHRR